jgi:nitrous oxidase accessory protein
MQLMLREFKLLFLALVILFAFGQVSALAEEEIIKVENGDSIQRAIDGAKNGDVIVLMPGVYAEKLVIDKSVGIRGKKGAVIDGGSEGNVILITASNVSIEGLTIQNSGTLQEDSGIYVQSADGTKISRNTVKNVHNGIYIANSTSNQLIENKISSYESHFSKRGNGIHLFKGGDHQLIGNEIAKVQDGIYFDFTKSIDVTRNQIRQSRYGMHFMFSGGILADRNVVEKNITGMMVMNSSGIQFTANKVTDHFHVRGFGVLIYESKDVLLEGNDLIRNSVGLSMEYGVNTVTRKNVIAANQVGLEFKGENQQNTFSENNFIGNVVQSKVSGKDMRLDDGEKGNYWDDYGSFDLSGDGIGEEAYKAGSLYDRLLQTQPYWQFFFESPSIKLWTKAEALFPSFGDANVFDARPLVEPVAGLVEKEPETREFVLETGVVGALFILFSLIVIVKGRKLL